MQDLTCVFEGIDNKGAIFISAINTAKNVAILRKHNIKAVLSIARGAYIDFPKEDIPHYLYLPADDIQSYNLSQHFHAAFAFIEQARRETNVLVHCFAGISRSATVTAAYLIKKYHCSLQKVLSHLKRKRSKIDPNPGFLKQLKELQREILTTKNQKATELILEVTPVQEQNKQEVIADQQIVQNYSCLTLNSCKQPGQLPKVAKDWQKQKGSSSNIKRQAEASTKRKQSLNCKIDRVKRNLVLEGRMIIQDENSNFCCSPSRVYTPLVYRRKDKIDFSKFEHL